VDGRGGARAGAGGPTGPRTGTQKRFAEAKARKEEMLADLRELERDRLRGALVARDQVISTWQSALSILRARLLSLPVKAAPLVMAAGELASVEHVLRRLISESLDELSRSDGLPAAGVDSPAATAGADGERVVGPLADAVVGGEPGGGPVDDKPRRVPARNHGLGKRPGRPPGRGDDKRADR
jgi:hypothetical protein